MSATKITGNFVLSSDQVSDLTDSGDSELHYHATDRSRANHTGEQALTTLADMDQQSFINLLKNGDFESWSGGASAAPDGWTLWGTGATVARESTIVEIGTYSIKLTSGVGYASELYQMYLDYEHYKGKTVTFGAWVWCDTANKARLAIYDGVGGMGSSFHSGNSSWEWIHVTMDMDSSSTKLQTSATLPSPAAAISAYFDGAILVEGSVCPAFSPKPLVDDGKTLEIDSNTNTVSVGGKLVMTCTPQILTGAGAISVETCITHLVTGGVGADAVTLADGIEGQEKIILIKTLTTGGDTSVITPTNFAHGTTFTGNQAGSIQNLIFTNGSWHWTGGRNTVIA